MTFEQLENNHGYLPINNKHRLILITCDYSFFYFCAYLGLPSAVFHKEWTKMFFDNADSVIAAPRGHAKSTWVSLMIIWIMLFPNKWKIKYRLNLQYLDIAYVTSVRRPVANNFVETFYMLFDTALKKLMIKNQIFIETRNSEKLVLKNETRLNIMTIIGGIRGVRAHFNFNDDLQKDKGQKIEEIIRIYEGSITPIMHPGGRAMILGTVKADDDIIMNYHNKKEYPSKIYKAINTRILPNGKEEEYALWPERLNLVELKQRKMKLTSATFSREYQNEPANDDFALIKLKLVQYCQDHEQRMFELETEGATYVSVDLARSDHKDADYTVFTLFQIFKNYKGNKKPVLCIKDTWVFHASEINKYVNEFSEEYDYFFYSVIMKQLVKWQNLYKPKKVFVEENQFQQTIVLLAKDSRIVGNTKIPAEGIVMGRQKQHEKEGIPKIRTLMMAKRLIFSYGDPISITKSDTLTDELQKWIDDPVSSKYICTARHDDQTMSLYVGILGILPLIDKYAGVSSLKPPGSKHRKNEENEDIKKIKESKDYDPNKHIIIDKPQIPKTKRRRGISLH